jgi:hypothetical protein
LICLNANAGKRFFLCILCSSPSAKRMPVPSILPSPAVKCRGLMNSEVLVVRTSLRPLGETIRRFSQLKIPRYRMMPSLGMLLTLTFQSASSSLYWIWRFTSQSWAPH